MVCWHGPVHSQQAGLSECRQRRSGKLSGQLDTNKGGQAWKVPCVRNARTCDNVVGIAAPHSRAHSDLCRVHSRKARLQVLGVPKPQRLTIGTPARWVPLAGRHALPLRVACASGGRQVQRPGDAFQLSAHSSLQKARHSRERAREHSQHVAGTGFSLAPAGCFNTDGGHTRRPSAAVIKAKEKIQMYSYEPLAWLHTAPVVVGRVHGMQNRHST
jgi:hypothetical protein